MTWLIVLLVIVLLLVVLLLTKVGLRIVYEEEDLLFRFFLTRLRIPLQFKHEKKEKKTTASASKGKSSRKKKRKELIKKLWANRDTILEMVSKVLHAPTLELLRVNIITGDEDVEKCAIKYGAICSAVGVLLATLENIFAIKKRDVNVQCDFMAEKILISGEAILYLRVYEIIVLSAVLLRLGLNLYRDVKSEKKVVRKI